MKLIVCVDDRGGMAFNHRRQSQDRALREDLLAMTAGARLLMNAYSAKQFPDQSGITVTEHPMEEAAAGDFCFVEEQDVGPAAEAAEELILYRWGRQYPADLYMGISLCDRRLAGSWEFPGFSHEKITKEVYVR